MASKPRVVLNMGGIRAVHKSPEVAAELQRLGEGIAAQANAAGAAAYAEYHHGRAPDCPPYHAELNEHRRVNVCVVRTAGRHGAAIERRLGILRSAGGKG